MSWIHSITSSSHPFIGLAPMDGITDSAFRQICAKYGQPRVMFTEFVSAEGLCHNAAVLLKILSFEFSQRPVVAQLFGKTPECFYQAAILVCALGFDGVDINMGCPAKKVSVHGSGAGLIKTPKLAQQIILASKKGVQDWHNGAELNDCPDFSAQFIRQIQQIRQFIKFNAKSKLAKKSQSRQLIPVSVKTRLGYDQPIINQWLSTIIETRPALITLHGRTLKQAYKGKADWSEIALAAQLAHHAGIPFLGNGDIQNYEDAVEHIQQYQVDGVLIGRASFGNPWVFRPTRERVKINIKQKAKAALEHAEFYELFFSSQEKYSFLPMRKHLAWYIKGIVGASQLRRQLVQTNNSKEVKKILKQAKLLEL